MASKEIRRAALLEQRAQVARDAAALRLVGSAVTVAAKAKRMWMRPHVYEVPVEDMQALIEAARAAGFKI